MKFTSFQNNKNHIATELRLCKLASESGQLSTAIFAMAEAGVIQAIIFSRASGWHYYMQRGHTIKDELIVHRTEGGDLTRGVEELGGFDDIRYVDVNTCVLCKKIVKQENLVEIILFSVGQYCLPIFIQNSIMEKNTWLQEFDIPFKLNIRDEQRARRQICGKSVAIYSGVSYADIQFADNVQPRIVKQELKITSEGKLIMQANSEETAYTNGFNIKQTQSNNIQVTIEESFDEYKQRTEMLREVTMTTLVPLDVAFQNYGIVLFDISKRELVPIQYGLKYMAISHSWAQWRATNDDTQFLHGLHDIPRMQSGCGYETVEQILTIAINWGYNYIWLDWLCVDQSDLNNQQYDLMTQRYVYAMADRTLVIIRGQEQADGIKALLKDDKCILIQDQKLTILDGVRWVQSNWTIQEIILSKEAHIVLSDGTQVEWAKLAKIIYDVYYSEIIKPEKRWERMGAIQKIMPNFSVAGLCGILYRLEKVNRLQDIDAFLYTVPHINFSIQEIVSKQGIFGAIVQVSSAARDWTMLYSECLSPKDRQCLWSDATYLCEAMDVPIRSLMPEVRFGNNYATVYDPIMLELHDQNVKSLLPNGLYLVLGGVNRCYSGQWSAKAIVTRVVKPARGADVLHMTGRYLIALDTLTKQHFYKLRYGVVRVGLKVHERRYVSEEN